VVVTQQQLWRQHRQQCNVQVPGHLTIPQQQRRQ
jgi:hypothetical protein